ICSRDFTSAFFLPTICHLFLHSFPTRRSSDLVPDPRSHRSYRGRLPLEPDGWRVREGRPVPAPGDRRGAARPYRGGAGRRRSGRSEEHTSELQSRFDLVCRLLLEKKKTNEKQI